MTTWAERARARISEKAPERPDRTDKTPVDIQQARRKATDKTDRTPVSSVSSVGVVALFKNTALSRELMDAAMSACEAHGDGDEAREQMRRDVMGTPPEQHADLLAHFQQTYGGRA